MTGTAAAIGATLLAAAIPSIAPGIPLTFVAACYLGALALIALALYTLSHFYER